MIIWMDQKQTMPPSEWENQQSAVWEARVRLCSGTIWEFLWSSTPVWLQLAALQLLADSDNTWI